MEDDRLDPRFASAVREALLDEVRDEASSRPARPAHPARAAGRRPRWQPVLALGIAAGVVVAFAIGFSVASQNRTSVPAIQPVHGDCAEILTSSAASEVIGKTLHLLPSGSALSSPERIAVPVVGGLQCAWSGVGDVQDAAGITMTVLPAASRPKHLKAETGCFGQNDGEHLQYSCNFDVVAGGHWTTGQLTGLEGGTQARTQADVARIRAVLRALPKETVSRLVDRTGWWSRVGCEALGKRAELGKALGHPDLQTEPGNGGMLTTGQEDALSRTVAANCILQSGSDTDPLDAEIHAFGGAAAVVRQQFDGAEVRRLADVQSAEVYLVTDRSEDSSALWVLDHGNALELSTAIGKAETLRPAISPILSVLGRHVR